MIPFREGKQPVPWALAEAPKLTAFLLPTWQETGSMRSTLPCALSSWQKEMENRADPSTPGAVAVPEGSTYCW